MSRLHDRMLRRRAEEPPVDPMHSIGNLADAMLVLAVGIMLALIIYWNVYITAPKTEQPAAPVPFDESELTEAPDGVSTCVLWTEDGKTHAYQIGGSISYSHLRTYFQNAVSYAERAQAQADA